MYFQPGRNCLGKNDSLLAFYRTFDAKGSFPSSQRETDFVSFNPIQTNGYIKLHFLILLFILFVLRHFSPFRRHLHDFSWLQTERLYFLSVLFFPFSKLVSSQLFCCHASALWWEKGCLKSDLSFLWIAVAVFSSCLVGYSSYLRVSSFSFGIISRHFVFPVVNCCCDRMMHFFGISLLLPLKMKCWCLSLQFLGSFIGPSS